MEILLSALFGLGLWLCFVALARNFRARLQLDARLLPHIRETSILEEIELAQPFEERIIRPILRGFARGVTRFTPRRNFEVMRHKLELAGNPYGWAVVDFLGLRGLVAVLAAILLFFLFTVLKMTQAQVVLFTAMGAVIGLYLPLFWLELKIGARQTEIRLALPDALDLLTTSVEAGLGLDAAIAQVATKWNNEISRVFGQTLAEVRLGKARRDALRDMARRAEVPDLTNFVAAVVQAEQLGVGIARVLRVQSDQMRVKRRQRAQELANQAGVKMVAPLVFFFFPSMFVVILGPAVIRFLTRGIQ